MGADEYYKPKATISGAPIGATNQTSVTLTIVGERLTYYKYKFDEQENYSEEIPIITEISLTELTEGNHAVYVIGCDEAGAWQPEVFATSTSWMVDTTSPNADAGPDQTVDEGVTVSLNGLNSFDIESGIASYLWEQIMGPSVTLSDSNVAQPTFYTHDVGPDGESLTFQLTVTDSGGLQVTDTCIVNITGDNDPPQVDAGDDQEVEEGSTVTLDGSNSIDPDDGIHRYLWSQISGIPVVFSDTTVVQPTFVTPPVNPNGA